MRRGTRVGERISLIMMNYLVTMAALLIGVFVAIDEILPLKMKISGNFPIGIEIINIINNCSKIVLDITNIFAKIKIPSSDLSIETSSGVSFEFLLPVSHLTFEDNLETFNVFIKEKKEIMTLFAIIFVAMTLPITVVRCAFINMEVLLLKREIRNRKQTYKIKSSPMLYCLSFPIYISFFLLSNIILVFTVYYLIT